MKIKIIAAIAQGNVIGKDGDMPWPRQTADMQHFHSETRGKAVLMGRKTWESLSESPLKHRTNIIVTSHAKDHQSTHSVIFKSSLEDAINAARERDEKELYVTGGAEIYRQTVDIADEIVMTCFAEAFEGDTFFPQIRLCDWYVSQSTNLSIEGPNDMQGVIIRMKRGK